MPDSNCYCFECKQPLTEIERHGQLLKGCLNCNIWWALRGGSSPRLSAAELRSLIKSPIGTRAPSAGLKQSAAEVRNLSHEITSLAAASSAHPLREARLAFPQPGFSRRCGFTISRFS